MLFLERRYLRHYGGSFTENFYGLKRERVVRIKGQEVPRAALGAPQLMRETLRLEKSDIWKNLAVLVGLPYLTRKLNEGYEIHVPQTSVLGSHIVRDALPPEPTIRQRVRHCYKWFLRKIYPSIYATYTFWILAFNLAYLFDNTKFSSPLLWLTNTRIRRMGEADHRAIALNAQQSANTVRGPARPGQSGSIFAPRNVYPRLLAGTRLLLPTSIFALKFLEWWHASDFARQLSRKANEGLELPPPLVSGLPSKSVKTKRFDTGGSDELQRPSTVSLSESDDQALHDPPANPRPEPPRSKSAGLPILTVPAPSSTSYSSTNALCPICLHPIQTPTAVQTGYVFCYTCIFKWVDGSHERQMAFLEGGECELEWEKEALEQGLVGAAEDISRDGRTPKVDARRDQWDAGKGRCAVTGRKVLGGTDGLRRLMI